MIEKLVMMGIKTESFHKEQKCITLASLNPSMILKNQPGLRNTRKTFFLSETRVEKAISKHKIVIVVALFTVESKKSEIERPFHPKMHFLLKECEDVFLEDLPYGLLPTGGIEHQIGLILVLHQTKLLINAI